MRKMWKIMAILLVMALIGTQMIALAETKNTSNTSAKVEDWETIYIIMKPDGKIDKVIGIDHLVGPKGTEDPITIGKTYVKGVEALENEDDITVEGDKIIKNTNDPTYYRVDLSDSTPLPFKLAVSWYLNGKKVKSDELSGKTGTVTLRVDFTSTAKTETSTVPMMAMVSLSLPTDKNTNPHVDSGMSTLVGDSYQVSAMILSATGTETSSITWHTKNFELPDIRIVVLPYFAGISLPDIDKQLSDVADALDKLSNLPKAHKEILNNIYKNLKPEELDKMVSGLNQIASALEEISDNLSKSLESGEGMGDMSKLDQLAEGLELMSKAISGYAMVIDTLRQNHGMLINAVDQLIKGTDGLIAGQQQLCQGLSQAEAGMNRLQQPLTFLAQGTPTVPSLGTVAKSLAPVNPQLAQVLMVYQGVASQTLAGYQQLETAMEQLTAACPKLTEGINQIKGGLEKVKEGLTKEGTILDALAEGGEIQPGVKLPPMKTLAQQLHQASLGIKQLEEALNQQAEKTQQMQQKLGELANGLGQMSKALKQMAYGVKQLKTGLSQVREAIGIILYGGEIKGHKLPSIDEEINALKEMSKGLNKGADKFKEEKEKIEKFKDAAHSLNTFLGKPKDAKGHVSFIVVIKQ